MAMRLVRKHGYMFWFARCLGRRVLVSSSTQQFGGRGNCLKGRRIFDTFGAGKSLAWLTLYNISIHVLQTVLCTLSKLLTKIILTIEGLFGWWSSSLFLWVSCLIRGWYCKEKWDASHSQRSKRQYQSSDSQINQSRELLPITLLLDWLTPEFQTKLRESYSTLNSNTVS